MGRALRGGGDGGGWTPLHEAAGNDHLECAEALLGAGADPNAGDGELRGTALHVSVTHSPRCIAALVAAGASFTAIDDRTMPPLFSALHAGCCDYSVAALVAAGCPVDGSGRSGYHGLHPLHVACAERRPYAASLFLRRGADGAAEEPNMGFTPAHFAARAMPADAGASLSLAGPRRAEEQVAADRTLCVEALALRGAPLGTIDRAGMRPLHYALQWPSHPVAAALLACGCPVLAREEVQGPAQEDLLRQLAAEAASTCDRAAALLRGNTAAAGAAGTASPEDAATTSSTVAALARHGLLQRQGSQEAPGDDDAADELLRDAAFRYADARPPLFAAAAPPLARIRHAAALRSAADELAATEAAARSLQALAAWQKCAAADDEGQEQPPTRRLAKATFVAAVCVGKWGQLVAGAREARREEAEAEATVEAAARQAEATAAALRASWVMSQLPAAAAA